MLREMVSEQIEQLTRAAWRSDEPCSDAGWTVWRPIKGSVRHLRIKWRSCDICFVSSSKWNKWMSLQHLYSSVSNNFQNQVDKTFLGHVTFVLCLLDFILFDRHVWSRRWACDGVNMTEHPHTSNNSEQPASLCDRNQDGRRVWREAVRTSLLVSFLWLFERETHRAAFYFQQGRFWLDADKYRCTDRN